MNGKTVHFATPIPPARKRGSMKKTLEHQEADYFAGQPTSRAAILALPVAVEDDLSPSNIQAAWGSDGVGWEPRRTRRGWVRAKVAP